MNNWITTGLQIFCVVGGYNLAKYNTFSETSLIVFSFTGFILIIIGVVKGEKPILDKGIGEAKRLI